MGSAMWMYDLTGGARIGKIHKRLNRGQAVEYMPTLPADRLAAAYLYYDAQTDDARLTLTIARTAALEFDAVIANGCRVTGFEKDDQGHVSGAMVEADGNSFAINAASIVNATGVWADDVRALDEGTHPDSIRPAKGIHITVPWSKVQNRIAVVIPVPKDRRSVFVVPWGGTGGDYEFTYIGTTDTDYDGSLDDPQCAPADIEYLLKAINFCVASPLTEADILGTWAGPSPSGEECDIGSHGRSFPPPPRARSTSGLISITGGKLTTYREMAADTVDEVIEVLGRAATKHARHRSRTKHLHLRGADGYESAKASAGSDVALLHLLERYGDEARSVLALADRDPALLTPLVPGLPYLKAEAVYAARHEMARSVDDVLTRRTRARLLARRHRRRRGRRRRAARPRARMGRRRASRAGRSLSGARQARAGCGSSSGDCARGGDRPVTSSPAPGQPTPPIELAGGAGHATSRLNATRVAVDDKVLDRLRDACPEVTTEPATLGRSQPRLVAVGDDMGAGRPGRGHWPTWSPARATPARLRRYCGSPTMPASP